MDVPRPLLRFAAPVLAVACIVLVRLFLDPLLGENSPLLLFVVAVALSACYGGFVAGLWATFLSAVTGTYLFLPPIRAFAPFAEPYDAVRLLLFAVVGLAVSGIAEAMRAARRQAAVTAAALRESEEKARRQASLLAQTHDAILIWEPGAAITYWNRGAEQLYGYSPDEAIGQRRSELPVTRYPAPREEFAAILERRGEWRGELTQSTRDGRQIVVDSRQVLVQGPDGQRLVLETNRDITEQRQTDQALRESEQRFRIIFEQAAIGLALVGLDGRWLRVNDRLCQITGYTPSELLARTFQQITHPKDLSADADELRRLLAGDVATCALEKRWIRADHAIVRIHLTLSLLRDDVTGEPRHFIAAIQEIATPEPQRDEAGQRA